MSASHVMCKRCATLDSGTRRPPFARCEDCGSTGRLELVCPGCHGSGDGPPKGCEYGALCAACDQASAECQQAARDAEQPEPDDDPGYDQPNSPLGGVY